MAFDIKDFLIRGKVAEEKFRKAINGKFSNREEDIYQHFDVSINITFDVKGLKKISRNDEFPDENYHYVEFKGVTGMPGWLYGDADFIAFEMNHFWILVYRPDLVNHLHEKCKDKITSEKPEPYKLYSRGKDIITLVPSIDLMDLSYKILIK